MIDEENVHIQILDQNNNTKKILELLCDTTNDIFLSNIKEIYFIKSYLKLCLLFVINLLFNYQSV